MMTTEDCSKNISREHYISRAILAGFPNLTVAGLPWHKDGKPVAYSASALTANILCTRHNSALAPLDDLAAHGFRALVAAPHYVTNRLHVGKAQHHLVSGDALELWMLKLLAGTYFSGIASHQGSRLRDDCTIDRGALVKALSGGGLNYGAGLYVSQGAGEMPQRAVTVAPLTDIKAREVVGVRVNFGTLLFETLLVTPPKEAITRMRRLGRFRPGAIDFNGLARDARVLLTWKHQGNTINRIGLELAPV